VRSLGVGSNHLLPMVLQLISWVGISDSSRCGMLVVRWDDGMFGSDLHGNVQFVRMMSWRITLGVVCGSLVNGGGWCLGTLQSAETGLELGLNALRIREEVGS
jgi:hypothetical protein